MFFVDSRLNSLALQNELDFIANLDNHVFFFKEKDQYGNDVVKLGRPLPVEYLLLDCPASTPNEPVYTFTHRDNSFPVENRFESYCLLLLRTK